ncbi:pol protein [Cucumis melo var. makuwa]|uniref:Pol protein n=1 Tax=Cucumis melo var. makuwa TaxID=1194695 RepID=A0A5A7UHQ2_CUCMM|nr:pol protein [Cucumis melo var. makuwa]
MYQDLRSVYWWRNMKREVADFVSRCLVCQQVKAPRQRPVGLLQPLSVPRWEWESVLTKSAHFVPGKSIYTASKWGQLYMTEIVRLHGVPVSIISDRDTHFTSKFWKGLQLALGTRLDFSTAFHPQTDGQTERLNQILEDMLRACVLEFSGSWDSHLHLMEFAYNNSYQATIGMGPFEALYGKCCRSLVCWGEVGEQRMLGPELVQTTNAAIQKIRARMLTAQSRQKSYADVRRKDLEFEVGDMVFLKVAPMKGVLRFEKKRKLSPRFVGPFEILERIGPVAYRLALPPSFSAVHDVFHVSMLRRYVVDPTHVVDFEPLQISENLSYEEQPVEILAREVKKLCSREISLVKVLWRNQGVEEATWERKEDMRALYLELRQPSREASSCRVAEQQESTIVSRAPLAVEAEHTFRPSHEAEAGPTFWPMPEPEADPRPLARPHTAPRPRTLAPSHKSSSRAPIPRCEPRLSAPRAAPICAVSRADPQPSSRAGSCSSSRAVKPSWLFSTQFLGLKHCNLDLVTSLLGKHTCLVVRTRQVNLQDVLGAPPGHRRPDFVPTGAHVARVEAEVRAKASWRATKSDRGEP